MDGPSRYCADRGVDESHLRASPPVVFPSRAWRRSTPLERSDWYGERRRAHRWPSLPRCATPSARASLLPVACESARLHSAARQTFHVTVHWYARRVRLRARTARRPVSAAIFASSRRCTLLIAAQHGERRHLRQRRSCCARCQREPPQTLKAVGAIHWHALKIWLRGTPSHRSYTRMPLIEEVSWT